MHVFRALLYVSLVMAPGYSSRPKNEDSVRSIITMAETTLVHIQKLWTKLQMTPQANPITPSIEGLTSISHDLALLENELLNPHTEHFGQIHADVSSMEGRVRFVAVAMNCPVQAKPGGETGNGRFPDSYLHLTLIKVQRYLEKLVLHKDKLNVC